MPRRLLLAMLAATVLAVPLAHAAEAQVGRATVRGLVTMADGSPVPGIPVTLQPFDGAPLATATTDAAGHFAIVDVAPGAYAVRADGAGLLAMAPIDVAAGESLRVVLRLQVPNLVFHVAERSDLPLDRARWAASGEVLRALPAPLAEPRADPGPGGHAQAGRRKTTACCTCAVWTTACSSSKTASRSTTAWTWRSACRRRSQASAPCGHDGPHAAPIRPEVWRGRPTLLAAGVGPVRWAGSCGGRRGDRGSGWHVSVGRRPRPAAARCLRGGGGGTFDRFPGSSASRQLPQHWRRRAALPLRGSVRIGGNGHLSSDPRLGRSRFDVPHGDAQDDAGQDQRQRTAVEPVASVSGQQPSSASSWCTVARAIARRVDARPVALASRHAGHRGLEPPPRSRRRARLARRELRAPTSLTIGAARSRSVALRRRLPLRGHRPGRRRPVGCRSRVHAGIGPSCSRARVAHGSVRRSRQDRRARRPLIDRRSACASTAPICSSPPRSGARASAAALDLPGLDATMRGSFNRFFQPPQAEHLLLSSSEAARALSPFVDDDEGGGAELLPERQTAWEAGWEQRLGRVTLDVAGWHARGRELHRPERVLRHHHRVPEQRREGHRARPRRAAAAAAAEWLDGHRGLHAVEGRARGPDQRRALPRGRDRRDRPGRHLHARPRPTPHRRRPC